VAAAVRPDRSQLSRPSDVISVGETTLLQQVTGAGSVNATDRAHQIHGTDLGILWDAGQGRVFVMFGDTYGAGWGGRGAGPGTADWRTNVLFASSTTDLEAEGLRLESAVSRVRRGGAAQAIRRHRFNLPRLRFPEHTLIPNSGITVNGIHHVHWMSVAFWRGGGRWRTFQAGVAVSRNDGRTWSKPLTGRWTNLLGRDRFQVGAFTRDHDWVYLVGTTNGRHGPAYLARVAPDRIARAAAYRYWDGRHWRRCQAHAAPIIDGPVGELSVAYHRGLGRWLALHLDEDRAAIVLRSAPRITGPWSAGVVAASGRDYPALYGGYLHPWFLDGDRIYWLMSQWDPYNVFLMRSTLSV
jgi:hypothetical protein